MFNLVNRGAYWQDIYGKVPPLGLAQAGRLSKDKDICGDFC
jgi:hypothetical protein